MGRAESSAVVDIIHAFQIHLDISVVAVEAALDPNVHDRARMISFDVTPPLARMNGRALLFSIWLRPLYHVAFRGRAAGNNLG